MLKNQKPLSSWNRCGNREKKGCLKLNGNCENAWHLFDFEHGTKSKVLAIKEEIRERMSMRKTEDSLDVGRLPKFLDSLTSAHTLG